jgi:hypothetical protein
MVVMSRGHLNVERVLSAGAVYPKKKYLSKYETISFYFT